MHLHLKIKSRVTYIRAPRGRKRHDVLYFISMGAASHLFHVILGSASQSPTSEFSSMTRQSSPSVELPRIHSLQFSHNGHPRKPLVRCSQRTSTRLLNPVILCEGKVSATKTVFPLHCPPSRPPSVLFCPVPRVHEESQAQDKAHHNTHKTEGLDTVSVHTPCLTLTHAGSGRGPGGGRRGYSGRRRMQTGSGGCGCQVDETTD